jgi:hypothetical protein
MKANVQRAKVELAKQLAEEAIRESDAEKIGWLMPRYDDDIEVVIRRAQAFTALLARCAQSESLADRLGTGDVMNPDAWIAIESLTGQVVLDINRMKREILGDR